MNSINLIGRITKDPEVKLTQNGTKYLRFCIAVDGIKDKEGNIPADFIDCIAWNKGAELIGKHFKKGSRIGINGRLHTTTFETDGGEKRKFVEVIVNSIDFLDPKKNETEDNSSEPKEPEPPRAPEKKIEPVETEIDLPFEI